MKKRILLHITTLALLTIGCGTPKTTNSSNSYKTTYTPTYANRFEIAQSGDTTIIITHNPWQGATGVEREFRFTQPLNRLVCLSSSHTALLEALDQGAKVVGVSGRDFLHSDSMRTKEEIGYNGSFAYEKIVALKPDVMTVYELSGENSSTFKKLNQMGVNQIYIAEYLENHPLAKAEWIVVFGALVGKQKEAIEVFDSIASRYNQLKEKVEGIADRPKIMFNSPYKETWYLPGSENYIVKMAEEAGGEYLGSYIEGSDARPTSFEKSYKLLLEADIWLNPSYNIEKRSDLWEENKNLKNITIPIFSNIARRTEAGGSDFWESGIIRPDVVLSDMIKILHPELLPDHELYYYREIK